MSVLTALELRKHDLRVQLVKLRADRNTVQMIRVYSKLCEVKKAESYLKRA